MILIVAAIVGGGLVTGLLFAFSNFVMRALAELPPEQGMLAMQRINKAIINPGFLVLFVGTPLLCAVIAVRTALTTSQPGATWLLVGSLAYLLGPFGITMLFNVPLNNSLARADALHANEVWPTYRQKWQRWNHVQTYAGVAAVLFLALGLSA